MVNMEILTPTNASLPTDAVVSLGRVIASLALWKRTAKAQPRLAADKAEGDHPILCGQPELSFSCNGSEGYVLPSCLNHPVRAICPRFAVRLQAR